MADLERCGSVIGGLVICELLRLLEDPPDGCGQSWLRQEIEAEKKRMYPSCSC